MFVYRAVRMASLWFYSQLNKVLLSICVLYSDIAGKTHSLTNIEFFLQQYNFFMF